MTAPAKKKAHIISSFTDAGTGESFTAGATPMIEVDTFANYEAAGLVRPAAVERKPKAPAKPNARTASRSAARRSTAGNSAPSDAADTPAPPAPASETAPSE